MRSKKGFTLVELLIAITIIAILSSLALVSYNTIQQNARDARRKTDISAMVQAVELNKQLNGSYPTPSCVSTTGGTNFSAVITTTHINKIPTDPSCNGGVNNTGTCACVSGRNNYYFGTAAVGTTTRIYFLADTETTTDISTCSFLTATSGGISQGGKVFKYCYAP